MTFILIYKSPGVPPLSPCSPCPLKGITFPVSTPAGILTLIVLFFLILPFPLHSLHGVSVIFPLPWQWSHVEVDTKLPKGVCLWTLTWPDPPHVGHVLTFVPGSAPEPLQCSQFSLLVIEISFSTPKTASSKVNVTVYSISLPLTGPFLLLELPPPPPKNDSKISPNPPISKPSNPPNPPPLNPPVPSNAADPNWSYLAFFSGSERIW